ncbi:ETS-related transcription factor Elf-2 [Lemmus lemmus]
MDTSCGSASSCGDNITGPKDFNCSSSVSQCRRTINNQADSSHLSKRSHSKDPDCDASTENGDKTTMQSVKIITIPATQQLSLCQLQTKSNLPGSGSIIIVGNHVALRALTPV